MPAPLSNAEALEWFGAARAFPGRLLLCVAHPDDELLGAGSRLGRLGETVILYATDGAPRNGRDALVNGFATPEAYARARRAEALSALALAGVDEAQTRWLHFADQGASSALPELARAILGQLRELRPEVVATHPYEGGHPDHDAVAFAVHAACALLERKSGWRPAVLEMAFYHGLHGCLGALEFLPGGEDERTLRLDAEASRRKAFLLARHATQAGTLQYFPTDVERFRPAPRYDFTRPPHPGTLFYERFDWGMTGARWRELARRAALDLHLA